MTKVFEPFSKGVFIGGEKLEFEQRVDVVIELGDRSIILLNTDDFQRGDPMVGRNVLCFDKNGEMLWRIEDAEMTIGDRKVPQSFLSLSLKDDGKIRVGNPDAFFFVNPENGMLYDGEFKYF